MKVGDIMNRTPVTARTTQTFAEAFQVLVDNRATNLPVVDPEGVFKGNFDLNDIWRTLLPRATQLARKSIEDLAFVSSSIEKLKERVVESGALPVGQFLNAEDAPALYPESPLTQAILLLDEHEETLAVVDRLLDTLKDLNLGEDTASAIISRLNTYTDEITGPTSDAG